MKESQIRENIVHQGKSIFQRGLTVEVRETLVCAWMMAGC